MTHPRFLRTSLLVALAWPTSQAMALPVVQDPELQPLMAAVSAEFQQYAANPVALTVPKEAKPWPCAVSQAELDVFAGTVDSDNDPVTKAERVNDARSIGILPSKLTYTNKVATPVRAQCNAGKLSGPVEFWLEYDFASSDTTITAKHRSLVRVRANARNGKPDGVVLHTGATLVLPMEYADPETAKMMASQPKFKTSTVFFGAFTAAGPAPKASVTTFRTLVDGALYVSTSTRFSRQDGQVVEDGYGVSGRPEHHDFRRFRRNGKLHGPQQHYAGMMGDIPVEASTVCWQDGERVLTNTCPSD